MTVLVTRPQLVKILQVRHHTTANHWVKKSRLEVVERRGRETYFDACELLAFFEHQKYLAHAQNLRQWIIEQEGK